MKRIKNTMLIKELNEGEQVVSMIEFKGTIYVATTKGVFKMWDGRLWRIHFVEKIKEQDYE